MLRLFCFRWLKKEVLSTKLPAGEWNSFQSGGGFGGLTTQKTDKNTGFEIISSDQVSVDYTFSESLVWEVFSKRNIELLG